MPHPPSFGMGHDRLYFNSYNTQTIYKTWLGNTQPVQISQFALCNTAIVCWHFHTLILKNILEPRGDRVIMESAYTGPRYNGVAVYYY